MIFSDENYIEECIKIAKKGGNEVSPNPFVGCIIVKNGKIIGKGWHKSFGGPHAEVNAIKNAGNNVEGATVYVNLEPCSYHGKTPPCSDLLIQSKIKKVVVGTLDPNPLVNGKGLKKLKKAGIDVKAGVLAEECMKLNEKFFKFISTGYPFITLKIAQTLDGKITSGKKDKNMITCAESRKIVHELRSEHDAVLIGANTVNADDPELTIRHIRGKQPYRIIITSKLDLKPKSKVLNDDFKEKTILITSTNAYKEKPELVNKFIGRGIRIYPFKLIDSRKLPLDTVLKFLAEINISSVLIEGGSKIFSSFYSNGLWDRMHVFIAPKILGKGLNTFNDDYFSNKNKIETGGYLIDICGSDLLLTTERESL